MVFGLLLVAGTLALYSPVRIYEFINYDDDHYVLENPHVKAGLSWQTFRWSLTSIEKSNWHPLTWLSHALDCQLFGLDAGGHHITSLVIHALNALLLFLLLRSATGAAGRSFLVAALFAWHPFNVESVAWVAERKNVLSTLFFLLTLAGYGWYVRHPRLLRLALVTGLFLLALASKPMAVTLPFVLLLLDYWPLQRIVGWTAVSQQFHAPQLPVWRLLLEKLPLFLLSAASSVVTLMAQRLGGSLRPLQKFSLGARLENALYSYVMYIWKAFWPSGFALHYPHPGTSLSLWKPIVAAALLAMISVAVWRQRRSRAYLLVGWLWFLGTLFPVIGIVQVGDQAMADRYAYLPLLGVFVILVWGLADFLDLHHVGVDLRRASALIALGALSFLTSLQVDYWKNSVTIWSHTVDVTHDNLRAEKLVAAAMIARGDTEQAFPHIVNVTRLAPNDIESHMNVGAYYTMHGSIPGAIREFEKVLQLTKQENLSAQDRRLRVATLISLGSTYAALKDYAQASVSFRQANQLDPTVVDQAVETIDHSLASDPSQINYVRLALLLQAKGNDKKARSVLEAAISGNPGYVDAQALMADLSPNPK